MNAELHEILYGIELMAHSAMWVCDEIECSSSMVMTDIDDEVADAVEIGGDGVEFFERIAAIRQTRYPPCTDEVCPMYDMADDIVDVAREGLGITPEMVAQRRAAYEAAAQARDEA